MPQGNGTMAESAISESVRMLENGIRQRELAIQQTENELGTIRSRLASIHGYLRAFAMAKSARAVIDGTIVWRPGAILIVVTAVGGIGLVVFRSPVLGSIGAIVATASMVFLLLTPSDRTVSDRHGQLEAEQIDLKSRVSLLTARHKELKSVWQSESDRLNNERLALEREKLAASSEHRRKLLLAERWKELRSVEFEQFLERVFVELGYTVETTKVTGDQGVDLVVNHRGKRIAIQVKGYLNSVSNGAVQEAYAGMAYYKCDAAAVITNSRFTASAFDLANTIGCRLIDEDSLPKLILGQVDLWSNCIGENK